MTPCAPPDDVISVLVESQLWTAEDDGKVDHVHWQPLMRHSKNQVWRATYKADQVRGFDIVIKLNRGQGSSGVNEGIFNQRLAAHHGLAPVVLEADAANGHVMCPFLPGGTLKPVQLENPDLLGRTVRALRRLHDIDGNFQHRHHYLANLQQREGKALRLMGDRTIGRLSSLQTAAAAAIHCLKATPVPARPCHSDMVTHNIALADDGQVIFVDWEVSGMGDPHEELANFIWSASLSQSNTAVAMAHYFDEPDEIAQARVILYLMLIPYDWVMRHQIAAQEPNISKSDIDTLTKRQHKRLNEANHFSRSTAFAEAMICLQARAREHIAGPV